MEHEYIQSKEKYKGFELQIVMRRNHEALPYHRRCHVFKDCNRIAICKKKKEAKALIDEGYLK